MSYAPSPRPTFAQTTAIPYARVTRYLWGDAEAGEVAATSTVHDIRGPDLLWRDEGMTDRLPVELTCATDQLTTGTMTLQPGQRSAFHTHRIDERVLVNTGAVFLEAHDPDRRTWLEPGPFDGAYVPAVVSHQYWNRSSSAVEIILAVAPEYLP